MYPSIPPGSWALAVCLWPGSALAAPLTADDVVRYTLDHHPRILAAEGDVAVADAERRQVSVFLHNPELSGGGVGDGVEAELTQPLSLTGEGWHARRGATLTREAAEANARRTRFVVVAETRTTWVHAVLAERRLVIAEQALALAGQLRAATETRQTVGEGSALEARIARLDEAHALAAALDARRTAAEARTALAALFPDAASAPLADDLDLPAVGAPTRDRSDVLAARTTIDARHAELRQARAAAVPALGVGALYQDAAVLPWVNVALPLWSRNQTGRAAALRDLAVAEAEADRTAAVADAEQGSLLALAAQGVSDLTRLGDPNTDARDALAAIRTAFDRGELDTATAVLLRGEVLAGWSAAVDAELAIAELTIAASLATEDPTLLEVTP